MAEWPRDPGERRAVTDTGSPSGSCQSEPLLFTSPAMTQNFRSDVQCLTLNKETELNRHQASNLKAGATQRTSVDRREGKKITELMQRAEENLQEKYCLSRVLT